MQERLEAELLSILHEVQEGLTRHDVSNIKVMFDVGEYKEGFDDLCTQIYERGAGISQRTFDRLAALGKLMHVEEETWLILKSLIE